VSAVLEFEAVNAGYGKARILHDMSFGIEAGQRAALLGRNGVGKTTVVNTLGGIARLFSGLVRIDGQPVSVLAGHTAARHGITVVPQGRRILSSLTVEENLRLGGAAGRSGPWNLSRVYELFPVLRERAHTPGTAMSGGQQQMLAIGRALMGNPRLLILDEPSEGLAPVIVDELAATLVRLSDREGMALLLIEQAISLVQRVAQCCFFMSKGAIVESGSLQRWSREELHALMAL